jgi:DNA-binding PadR family transcriptional regulator
MKGEPFPEKTLFSIPRGFMGMHILRILETPHHGYEIIKEIEQECIYWKPSPGSVYPILQKLRKAKLITEKAKGRKNVYTITKAGREKLKKFELHKNEIKEKMTALFRMMGGDAHIADFEKGFEIFEKIRKDPARMRKAAKLRDEFHRKMVELARE